MLVALVAGWSATAVTVVVVGVTVVGETVVAVTMALAGWQQGDQPGPGKCK